MGSAADSVTVTTAAQVPRLSWETRDTADADAAI
jgi:hypothetical protein